LCGSEHAGGKMRRLRKFQVDNGLQRPYNNATCFNRRIVMSLHPGSDALQEIDDLLEEVARLSRRGSSPEEFHLEVLDRAVRALAASGGAVWRRLPGERWRIDSRIDVTGDHICEALADNPAHGELLDAVLQTGAGRIVLPRVVATGNLCPNPTDHLLLVSPIEVDVDRSIRGALEIYQRPGAAPSSQQGHLRVLAALSDLAADFHAQCRMRLLEEQAARSRLIDQFSRAIHASLDVTATACAIANEGRRLIECDRLSVAVRRGNSYRLRAVSGLETLDRRANVVRRLEDLTAAVVAAGEPFWSHGQSASLPPEIAAPFSAWQDESHARSVAIVPIAAERRAGEDGDRPVGAAVIAEHFAGVEASEAFRERLLLVARHAELALANAIEHESLPLIRPLRALQRAKWFVEARRLPKTALVAALTAAALLALVFVPAAFEIEGRGVLQPESRREVFARTDGIVVEVRAEHAQPCREGDVLVVMTRSQLDFEWSRVLGEMQTARQRLASVQAARLDLAPQTAADREKYNQLTADEAEAQEQLNSLAQQHEVLKAQREELLVRSPLTGQVVTWNVRQTLQSRPVQRGQVLLQVADTTGPWVLEVEVPDDRVGHVLEARGRDPANLAVSFMLATEPGVVYRGKMEKLALATDVRPPDKATVLMTVAVDRDQIRGLRPGATVVAHIDCGRRSLGFVWFHGIWETLQRRVFFWL
jgi:biotin carboxyl carrier protein